MPGQVGTAEDRSFGKSEIEDSPRPLPCLRSPVSALRSPLSALPSSPELSDRPTEALAHRSTDSPLYRPTVLWPLLEVSSWLTGRRGVALPFSDLCPPLVAPGLTTEDQNLHLKQLWSQLIALAQQRRWRSIEVRGGPAPVPDARPSVSFHGHVLDLGEGESKLFSGLHPSVRRAIRKAQQSGLRVESTHALDALHSYYALHLQTRQRHGLPPQPFGFFLTLYDQMIASGNGFISLARLGARAIAGAIFLHAGRNATYKYGASDPAQRSLRPNDLLFWDTICQLAADGFTALHFGRADLHHEGLRRFKLGWGTREVPIHYFRFDLRTNTFVGDRSQAKSRYHDWFERLPLMVNRLIGRLAYRHLD